MYGTAQPASRVLCVRSHRPPGRLYHAGPAPASARPSFPAAPLGPAAPPAGCSSSPGPLDRRTVTGLAHIPTRGTTKS